ncbi:ribosomal protein S18-alanine N-acetyltransferase [Microbulbifer sp. OS29]|uniref:[Ribosomal protein bS18]-alanine N-acetyltransferase n=1 Tax=Microbulbifer okhotskensis TaxID=2926617 RepID=A0A9X2EKB7_9GAMM|nr:ribosomal protein S18-alanine N-acetyltransferase [Microbulbifer okhotskensis]MCO1333251.1 ribosomal protein S18-alanine N-acetyltransferase [Microbulbifer okhotskensis]
MDRTDMRLRVASAKDSAALALLAENAHNHAWSESQYQQSFSAGHYCWVMEQSKNIIACCVTSKLLDEAEILDIAVSPAWRRRGLAEALLENLIATLPAEIARLLLEVRVSNLAARSLYRKLGFSEDGMRKNYYPALDGRREDAVLMSLALNGAQS